MTQIYTREQVDSIIDKERKLITTLLLRIGHKMDSECPGARDGFWPANVVYQCAKTIRKRKSSAWADAVAHDSRAAIDALAGDGVLVRIGRPEGYEGCHPDLIAVDAMNPTWEAWEIV